LGGWTEREREVPSSLFFAARRSLGGRERERLLETLEALFLLFIHFPFPTGSPLQPRTKQQRKKIAYFPRPLLQKRERVRVKKEKEEGDEF
jgi:hypothetical protein